MRMKRLAIMFAVAVIVAVGGLLFIGSAPASAIVHPVAPICIADEASEGKAGGKAAGAVLTANPNVDGPPMPARGEENSGDNSPAAPGGECP